MLQGCTPSLPSTWRLTASRCSCNWSPGLGKSLMRITTPVIRLLSSGCHSVLAKVNGKIPIDFQVWGTAEPVLLFQEGVCNYLAAQTAWAQFSRVILVFRLALCVSTCAVSVYPAVHGMAGEAEAILRCLWRFLEIQQSWEENSTKYMKKRVTVNLSLKVMLSLCQSCLVKKSKVCPVSGEHRVPLHPSGKGMVALILLSPEHLPELQFHIFCTGHSTWAHFSRLSFPSWKVIVEKVKTVIGPRIWVLLQNWNLLFFFPCWFILNQLVKLTPCHNKLGSRYLQDM